MQRRKANTNRVFIFSDFLGLYRTANRFSAFRSCKIMTQCVNCSLKYRSSGTPLVNLELSSYIYLPMKQTNHPVIYQSCQSCVFSSCGTNPTSQSTQATHRSPKLTLRGAHIIYAYNLLIFAYFISRQNIRVCMENATKTL